MKLKKIHLFFILLLTLFSSSLLGCINKEGYDNKETTDDHGMHIVGLYKDQKGRNFFLVKDFQI